MDTFLKHNWDKIYRGGPKPENFRRQRLQLLQLLSSAQSLLPCPPMHLEQHLSSPRNHSHSAHHAKETRSLRTTPEDWNPPIVRWMFMFSSSGNGGGQLARDLQDLSLGNSEKLYSVFWTYCYLAGWTACDTFVSQTAGNHWKKKEKLHLEYWTALLGQKADCWHWDKHSQKALMVLREKSMECMASTSITWSCQDKSACLVSAFL